MPSPTDTDATDEIVRFAWEQLEAATESASTRSVHDDGRGLRPLAEPVRVQLASPSGSTCSTRSPASRALTPATSILVAARPATGKSTVLAQAAVAAATSGVGVLYVTLEMVAEEVLERCMANAMATSIRTLRETGVTSLPSALRRIRVIDSSTATTDIAAVVRQSRRSDTPIGLVLVDYLQQLTPPGRSAENRQTEVAAISRGPEAPRGRRAGRGDRRIPAQPRVGDPADKRPSLADLRESGQLEADADVVVLMHRDLGEPFEIEFIIAKNRHGATGGFAAEPDFARSLILETPGSQAVAV